MEYKSVIISKNMDDNLKNLISRIEKNPKFHICQLYESEYTNDYNILINMGEGNVFDQQVDKQKIGKYECDKYNVYCNKREIMNLLENGKIPVFVVAPAYFKKVNDGIKEIGFTGMSFLLKDFKDIDKNIDSIESECFSEINYVIEIQNDLKVYELILKLWEFRQAGGGINREVISLMLDCGLLIKNGSEKSISNASYDLSLGDEFFYGGKIKKLSNSDPFIIIEPYDYVIASCDEIINFPRDVVGKFDVSVDLFCQGIILSNSTQVDPGFKGKLFCLLFNTSNKIVCIKRREHFVTMDFQKLLEATTPYSGRFSGKESIISYLPNNVMQGAINELKKEIEELKKESKNMQNMYMSILALILAVIAIIIVL